MAANRTRNHSLCRSLVPSILIVLAECRRAFGGARPGSRSHDGVALGAALWPRIGTAAPASPQAHQQIRHDGRFRDMKRSTCCERELRKGQVRWVSGTDVRCQNQFINKVFEPPESQASTPAAPSHTRRLKVATLPIPAFAIEEMERPGICLILDKLGARF